eukprot:1593226-Pyramimonas_sp.AAC.1
MGGMGVRGPANGGAAGRPTACARSPMDWVRARRLAVGRGRVGWPISMDSARASAAVRAVSCIRAGSRGNEPSR